MQKIFVKMKRQQGFLPYLVTGLVASDEPALHS